MDEASPAGLAHTAWEWPDSKIVKVIDGDTVDVMVTRDIGFGGKVVFPIRLRLNRINSPKISSAAGKAARDRVALEVDDYLLRVTTVKAYKYGGPAEQTGEFMAEIVLPNGKNLSDLLVENGLAVYWTGVGPRPSDS